MKEETRVLIVGSGVAGSLIAEQLLSVGMGPVVMLEAGPGVVMRDRRAWLDYLMAHRLPYTHLSDTAEDYQATGGQAWRIEGGRLLARGGSTLHWGGWCPRMKPEDFSLQDRIGSGGLNWPIDYATLEPYYHLAEHYLQVAGDSREKDPPRDKDYPFEAPAFTLADGEVIQAFEKLGISYGHVPLARNGQAINGMPACVTTGTCGYCPVGGRFTGDQPLERLQRQKDFTLRVNTPVSRILMGSKRRIRGAAYLDQNKGTKQEIEAEITILCTGALETPKLLLASRSRDWPEGIGNGSDQVGRHLIANPYFFARGIKPVNKRKIQEELHFVTLGSRYWDTPEQQREGKFFINRGATPDLDPASLMSSGASAAELEKAASAEARMELHGAMQTFSHHANRVRLGSGTTRFGLPRTHLDTPVPVVSKEQTNRNLSRMRLIFETMGYTVHDSQMGVYPQRGDHAMCTCRMSERPSEGVVDENLKVHGIENLHVLSNAVFPSGSAANPTLTLAALAFRLKDHLVGVR